MPPRQLHCSWAGCKLRIWLAMDSSFMAQGPRASLCTGLMRSSAYQPACSAGHNTLQTKTVFVPGEGENSCAIFSWTNDKTTFSRKGTGNRRKLPHFFVQMPGPLLYIHTLEVWITHAEAFVQIKCCATLWKITSRNMVQMMQIQGMWYGVENSLKLSLQEVSLKIVGCAGTRHTVCAWKQNLFVSSLRME